MEGREKEDRRWACTPILKVKSAGPVTDRIRGGAAKDNPKISSSSNGKGGSAMY